MSYTLSLYSCLSSATPAIPFSTNFLRFLGPTPGIVSKSGLPAKTDDSLFLLLWTLAGFSSESETLFARSLPFSSPPSLDPLEELSNSKPSDAAAAAKYLNPKDLVGSQAARNGLFPFLYSAETFLEGFLSCTLQRQILQMSVGGLDFLECGEAAARAEPPP